MINMSQEFDTAGPLNVEAIDACVEEARRQAEDAFAEQVEMTKRDEFACVVGGLVLCAIGRVAGGVSPSEINYDLGELINDNLGSGPASLGYLIADLAEIMLHDPLDDIPVIDTPFDR